MERAKQVTMGELNSIVGVSPAAWPRARALSQSGVQTVRCREGGSQGLYYCDKPRAGPLWREGLPPCPKGGGWPLGSSLAARSRAGQSHGLGSSAACRDCVCSRGGTRGALGGGAG